MSADYTLPPVPDHPFANSLSERWSEMEEVVIENYGHACAEAARAPLAEENARLLARIAELERVSENKSTVLKHIYDSIGTAFGLPVNDAGDALFVVRNAAKFCAERDRLRAELAQVSGYCETLTQRCVDDTAENARLHAEVEALKSALAAERADAERYAHLKSIAKVGNTKRQEFVITLDLVPCPGHIGMLDLALDADRNYNNKEPTPE